MKNVEEKALKKNWKNWTTRLVHNPGPACNFRLAGKSRLTMKSRSECNSRLARRSGSAREGPRGKAQGALSPQMRN